jgi:alcohol dehydrogenase (cytochrome c)
VPTGWGGWVEGFLPAMLSARAGSAVFAFALPE